MFSFNPWKWFLDTHQGMLTRSQEITDAKAAKKHRDTIDLTSTRQDHLDETGFIQYLPLYLERSKVSAIVNGKRHHGRLVRVQGFGHRFAIRLRDPKNKKNYLYAYTISSFIKQLGGKPGAANATFRINKVDFPVKESFFNLDKLELAKQREKGRDSILRI